MGDEERAQVGEVCRRAKAAARRVAVLPSRVKDGALRAVARALRDGAGPLLEANAADVARANDAGVAPPLVDRLTLDPKRLEGVARAVEQIAAQVDPVGEVLGMTRRPNGLEVGQVRVPLGVVAMVYEARPNVTVEAAALTLKSGNAVVLRGGSDASSSNAALGRLVRAALEGEGVAADAVQMLSGGRDVVKTLVAQEGLIDLVIPRGGEGLIRFVTENARVPVIQHYKGVCHLYFDEGCDGEMAVALAENGKAERPGTCNATECVLVHRAEAERLVPALGARMEARGVEVRGCERVRALFAAAQPAREEDFGAEFLDLIIAVKVVDSFDDALGHVARYGSGHTEAICTRSYERSRRWLNEVDASCVLVNASTRFNDGGELGLGAEIGISTSKLHAFGPMGAEHLTTKKWIVLGDGQLRR